MARLMFTTTGGFQAAPEQAIQPPTVVPCNPALQQLALARKVLLLQGPVGPFFDRLTRWLVGNGASVSRVVFHAGDVRDCTACAPIRFEGQADAWPAFFESLLAELQADAVVLFGQSRRHHAAAIERAQELGLPVIVLEEGYLRPAFVTMELGGVNGSSTTLDNYRWEPGAPGLLVHAKKPSSRPEFWEMAGHACRHYWSLHWGGPLSPDYRHHRQTDVWHHSRYWLWSWAQKHLHLAHDHACVRRLADRPYFFVPLQHEGDSQIAHHSPYPEIKAFVADVIESFAVHAPKDCFLVFKTHPHARGGPSYRPFIRQLSAGQGLAERVLHLVEGHTPTLVKNAQGVVLINSTVGVQALLRRKPLAVLGNAVYKRPGLYFEGTLDDFWTDAAPPDAWVARQFVEQLIALTQVPCRIYAKADEPLTWHVQSDEAA